MTVPTIREEQATDCDGVRQVSSLAFPTHAEADLIERLRDDHAVCVSVVAVSQDTVVGHALFSRAHLELPSGSLAVGALGPVAVLPEQQRRGIGASLIRAGLERCWALGLPAVIVLGHPAYYPRFGFRRADTWAIRCEFGAPPEPPFMIAWSTASHTGPGVVKYHPAFAEV